MADRRQLRPRSPAGVVAAPTPTATAPAAPVLATVAADTTLEPAGAASPSSLTPLLLRAPAAGGNGDRPTQDASAADTRRDPLAATPHASVAAPAPVATPGIVP
ncbi:hypothetical protein HK405_013302, partial [Cladochytrium tenue]